MGGPRFPACWRHDLLLFAPAYAKLVSADSAFSASHLVQATQDYSHSYHISFYVGSGHLQLNYLPVVIMLSAMQI